LNGKVEDGGGDLLSTSAGLGGARDGSAMRWPWTTVRFTRKRERERPTVGKKEGDQGVEEREEGEAWHHWAAPGVLLDVQAVRSRRWHRRPPGTATQLLEVEDKEAFSENPLDL
jgi:hypothetical protein